VWHGQRVLSALSIIFRVVSDLISWFGLLVRPRKSLEAEILNKSIELHDPSSSA